jgi:hypothetical protein
MTDNDWLTSTEARKTLCGSNIGAFVYMRKHPDFPKPILAGCKKLYRRDDIASFKNRADFADIKKQADSRATGINYQTIPPLAKAFVRGQFAPKQPEISHA